MRERAISTSMSKALWLERTLVLREEEERENEYFLNTVEGITQYGRALGAPAIQPRGMVHRSCLSML
jgi:hypothetical protein